jgi:hypothetical protein
MSTYSSTLTRSSSPPHARSFYNNPPARVRHEGLRSPPLVERLHRAMTQQHIPAPALVHFDTLECFGMTDCNSCTKISIMGATVSEPSTYHNLVGPSNISTSPGLTSPKRSNICVFTCMALVSPSHCYKVHPSLPPGHPRSRSASSSRLYV